MTDEFHLGERGSLESFASRGDQETLRKIVTSSGLTATIPLVGPPATVAVEMGELMEQIGGDGFLITSPVMRLNRRYVTDITDGLRADLQKLGLTRTECTTTTLRHTLREF